MSSLYKICKVFLLPLMFFVSFQAFAQPQLPEIHIDKQQGTNILSWLNPYTKGIKAVEIQRSKNENGPFDFIGKIENVQKEKQIFVDAHPLLGDNYYRVRVVFNSNVDWTSNTASIGIDSLDKKSAQTLPSSDSIQTLIEQVNGDVEFVKEVIKPTYPISKLIFTDPFTGNVNIEIPNSRKERYSIDFYTLSNKKVLEIERIREDVLILDKRNFQDLGVYKFKLMKNKEILEEGFITIN